ncbi:MAG: protoporphyrin/coproporphyrin ferrochelatase [Frankiaceae bacterium]|nr:protoporphyrin/coproporphyrin ferrochelatase [Frankiaceae bacterium]
MTVGVLVMAYGTPRDRDDIETYYTDIRRGWPPTPELLADLVRRYDALGGTFPLRALTDAQVASLASSLGPSYVVTLGTKHSVPRIEDGVETLVAQGVSRIIGLVLAPHYSAFSVGEYTARAAAAGAARGVTVDVVESWHLLPAYLDFLDRAVGAALSTMPTGAEVVFTAHSLPERILATGDPYPAQLRETAAAVAARRPDVPWSVAWQSAGRTPEPWLGPDVLEVLRSRSAQGSPGVVVCACGFVADHLEVAYDLDIEAAAVAAELDLPFARTASVNDDAAVLAALAELVAAR